MRLRFPIALIAPVPFGNRPFKVALKKSGLLLRTPHVLLVVVAPGIDACPGHLEWPTLAQLTLRLLGLRAGRLGRTLRLGTALVAALRAGRLGRTLRLGTGLVRTVWAARLGRTLRLGTGLVRTLRAGRLARTLRLAGRLARTLQQAGRLVRTLRAGRLVRTLRAGRLVRTLRAGRLARTLRLACALWLGFGLGRSALLGPPRTPLASLRLRSRRLRLLNSIRSRSQLGASWRSRRCAPRTQSLSPAWDWAPHLDIQCFMKHLSSLSFLRRRCLIQVRDILKVQSSFGCWPGYLTSWIQYLSYRRSVQN